MKTHDARWMRVRDLFEQAIEMPADQREQFIEKNCGDDVSLRDELKSLLAVDAAHSESPLTSAIGAAVDATTRDRRQELLGTVIGPYRLTSVLGHGGAGTVYLGERIDRQYSAQVAVKVVEGAALHAEIGRRFRAERQILANLNHPNIARLIDAGETQQGYPYLVMEYIHGEPINIYCDRLQLNVEQRIEIVLKVCAAVHYAHQNLVIHRDLKPGNILVTPDGTPKLLDFGIAKLLDTGAAAAEAALTRLNDRILTPEYASPEQILGQNVTTSSDVYALGVVLYELLSGMRPYRVSSTSQLELERTICINDPSKPSTAVREALNRAKDDPTPTRSINTIADSRSATPMRLRSQLDGDLDAIVMRALRKEPIHRYNSVEQLSADLRRHLQRAPVIAREGNWLYYTNRFARRHVFGVSVTAVFIVVLAAALIVTSVQAKRIAEQRDSATREKQTSEAVASFMVNVFAAADPFTVQNRQITAGELLDRATDNIRNDLDQQPVVKASLLEAMGRTYSRQGQPDKGNALIEEAISIQRSLDKADTPAFATSLVNLGKVRLNRKDYRGAESPLVEAIEILKRNKLTHSVDYAYAIFRLAELENQRGNVKKTLALYEEAVPLFRSILGERHPETATVIMSYGFARLWTSEYAESERLARVALDIYRSTVPKTNPDRITAEGLLGVSLLFMGQYDQAEPLLKNCYLASRQVFGVNSVRVLDSLNDLVMLYRKSGNLVAAEANAREAISMNVRLRGESNYETAQSRESLAIILWKRGQLTEAQQQLQTALRAYESTLPADHLFVLAAEHFYSEVLLAQGKLDQAESQLRRTIARLQKAETVPWRIARSENTLSEVLRRSGKTAEAKSLADSSYKILSTSTGIDLDSLNLARERLESHRQVSTEEEGHRTIQRPSPRSKSD
ncbi:MAG TPA: serine/threonine-protein kinase [Steroidobacteraceae bacterium]|nr:serine/threonine-protein kinase [Steroidobacteraceae bacterium]